MSEAQTRPVALRRPIIAAAVASTYVERRRLFQGQSIIVLNDALARHPSSTAFNPTGSTAAIRSFMLEDVVLDGSTLVLTKDGQVIAETDKLRARPQHLPGVRRRACHAGVRR